MGKRSKHLPLIGHEVPFWSVGMSVAGADEAGCGAIAGPVVAACVIMPKQPIISGINDSKKLSPQKRAELRESIDRTALSIGVGICPPKLIDTVGVDKATHTAFIKAVDALDAGWDVLFTDYIRGKLPYTNVITMVRGDSRVYNVAAASIVAKTTRDDMMVRFGAIYPGYGFEKHKGYGTPQHRKALRKLGPCPIHRNKFTKTFLSHGAEKAEKPGKRSVDLSINLLPDDLSINLLEGDDLQ